jgi:RHS repeat-associated protein
VRTIKQGYDNRLVFSDTEFNHLAQVARVSRDYYPGDHIYWATSEYDILNRVVRATEPGPHGSTNDIVTDYNGLVTTVTIGSEQLAKTTTLNAIGQKVRVDEETGTYVEYTYNSDGNLLITRVAGDDSTIIRLYYDDFGRKVAMDDPDMGRWIYNYNNFGELVSQTDAKGQTVTMSYDILGRMVSRTEPEGTSTWEYYGNTSPQGSIGKLYRESGNGLSRTFTYDSLGRSDSTVTTIGSETFTAKISYDSLGRPKRTTYPGTQGFWTENVYDEHGFLTAVQGSRSQAEQHDYSRLQPLISQATQLADDYVVRANKLRSLGNYYQSRIDDFTRLLAQQTIEFESGSTAGLEQNRTYEYLAAADGSTHYIRVPDTFIPIGSTILIPVILPAKYHYKVTEANGQQTISQITAAEFNAISASLANTGDRIKVLNNKTITCACDNVGHDQYLANLQQHQVLLNQVIAEGQATGVNTKVTSFIPVVNGDILIPIVRQQQSMALSPELLAHINNTLVELQTVQSLINQQAQSYTSSAEQLVVLAEQTLAAADHNYQFAYTLDTSAAIYGDLQAESSTDTMTYWRAVDVDASGRVSAEVYGNGIVNDYAYNQATGQLQSIHSSQLVIDAIRHLEYQYDAYQNVTLRHDLVNDIRETFEYDRLDRLTTTHVSSDLYDTPDFNSSQSQQYDVLGNITYKSDVGNYSYNSRPHAVTQAGGNTYTYDANGNMTGGAGRTIQYSSFNKPTQITQNGRSASFSYGPDRSRYKKVNHKGDITLYLGSYERTSKANGSVEQKHYISAGGQLIAEHIVSTEKGTQTRYLHKDALGSIDLVTDAYANVVDRRSFDAWGKLRNLPWQSQAGLDDPLYLTQLPYTNKGYTGHEHVQEVDLIHMNGRMYDATLARFISADPHIQAASSSQSYNRYSYVLNNPLKYSDPSGYFFKKLFHATTKAFKAAWQATVGDVLRAIAKVPILNTIANIAACTTALGCAAYAAASTYAVTGDFSGALLSGAVSFFTAQISGVIKDSTLLSDRFLKAVAHGFVGGTASVIQGGKFGHGFSSSFVNKILSGDYKDIAGSEFGGAAISVLVGGTVSKVGGGKFANGARTAMTQYLYNELGGEGRRKRRSEQAPQPPSQELPIVLTIDAAAGPGMSARVSATSDATKYELVTTKGGLMFRGGVGTSIPLYRSGDVGDNWVGIIQGSGQFAVVGVTYTEKYGADGIRARNLGLDLMFPGGLGYSYGAGVLKNTTVTTTHGAFTQRDRDALNALSGRPPSWQSPSCRCD